MSEQRIRVYRAGDRVVVEDIVLDSDYQGALKSTLLMPAVAIDIGEAMAAIGREIIAERNPKRAEVVDPEPKPPEALETAVDGAGSSSETNARQSGPAAGRRSGARGEDDGQTLASAAGTGGSPVFSGREIIAEAKP